MCDRIGILHCLHKHLIMIKSYKLLSAFLVILFLSSMTKTTLAQGNIKGTIIDRSINSNLPGTAVILKGSNYGTISDIYGNYTLTGLSEGEHTIQYSFIGYYPKDTTITVKDGESLNINITLDVKTVVGQEITITAQLLGQSKAINQQLNSDAIANMVSEDKLKELPDANAAEAIGRVSGISLQRNQGEGQKVVIRGLEPRFSAITVNGIKVPSNDPNDKSVDLSMISPELLQGIEVFKSPTPDMDAEAVGGTVNLLLSKAAETPQLRINASGGYSALREDFGNYNFSAAYNRRFFDNKLGIIAQANTERINRSSDKINYSYKNSQSNNIDAIDYNSVRQERVNEIRERVGGSVNIDYKLANGGLNFYSLYSNTNRDFRQHTNYYSYVDAEANINYDRWKGNTNLLSNMLSGKHTLGKIKTDWSLSYAKTQNERGTDYNMELRNTRPFGGKTLDGTHPNNWINNSELGNDSSTYLYEMSSDQQDISESNSTAALNFELPLQLNDNWTLSLKVGGKYNYLNRIRADQGSWEPWYYFGIPGKTTAWDPNYPYPYSLNSNNNNVVQMKTFVDNPTKSEAFLSGTSFYNPIDDNAADNWHNYFKDDFLSNRAIEVNNTDITETITAGYAMGKIKYKNTLTVIAGVRAEKSDNEYQSKISSLSGWDNSIGTISDTVTTQNYTEFFPHLHFKYEPTDWYSLRLSAARTMARPNYNYLAISAYINNNTSKITAGNPQVKHMTAMNYDLNMTFYNGKYGLLTLGAFYKDLKNIFYEVENLYLIDEEMAAEAGWEGKKGYQLSSYDNSPKAEVYGFEVDLQSNLSFLPKPFNGVVFNANLTRLFSSTDKYTNKIINTDSLISFSPAFGPQFYSYTEYQKRKITIPGQVPLILNLSLGYEINGFSARVSGNYQGIYLSSIGESTTGVQDRYRNEFWRWDLALKQKITKNLEVFFNANNLNNMKEITTVSDAKREGSTTVTGSVYNLGIRIKL